jgi:predicted ferric reductase
MTTSSTSVVARHIQNMSEAKFLQPHWGYADRALPCTNDPGSCEYLDTVYHSHDLGMLYTFVLWATTGGTLFIWCIGRHLLPRRMPSSHTHEHTPAPQSSIYRLLHSTSALLRSHLLPEATTLRPIFGRTTRLQLLILAILTGYLTIFTFVGLVYKKWITPVKDMPGVYNTRTGLGPFADRVGVLAYALTPLSILLASRESVLSLITGLPYQSFNFLHRWLGYMIYVQSVLHTIGWVIVEAKLYQPQPSVWESFIAQKYMVWGVVAMVLLSIIFFMSLPCMIRLTGYEVWRKVHYVTAMLYLGACWGHWSRLYCWMLASLMVWFVDRGVRLARTGLLHYQYVDDKYQMGFRYAEAQCRVVEDAANGDVVRIDFEHNHGPWMVGQHFYLTFADGGIWQSHPFTPLSVPSDSGFQKHSYIFRAKSGETKRVADMLRSKRAASPLTPVVLSGPYGSDATSHVVGAGDINVLCVAGGTGITFVLPVLLKLTANRSTCQCDRKFELIWAVRRKADIEWIRPELDTLQKASKRLNLKIRMFVTRDDQEKSTVDSSDSEAEGKGNFVKVEAAGIPTSFSQSSSSDEVCCAPRHGSYLVQQGRPDAALKPETRHPDLRALVHDFVESTVRGPTTVFASGPGGMISDLREVVARRNSGAKVMKGNEGYDVRLINDDRLEW